MSGSSHRLLLLGSAISGVKIGSLPDCDPNDTYISVPGVPRVQRHVLDVLRAALTAPTDEDRVDHERYVTPEIRRVLEEMAAENTVLGFAYRTLAYESLVEQVWLTVPAVAMELLETCRAARPNFNHFAVATALLSGEVAVVYTTNFDELIEIAVQLLAGRDARARTYQRFTDDHAAAVWQESIDGRLIRVVKLHGTITHVRQPNDIAELVCRYSDVAKPLPEEAQAMLARDLAGAELHVLGYSGSDLDIRPVLLKAAPEAGLLQLRWHGRASSGGEDCVERARQRGRKRLLEHLDGVAEITNLADAASNALFRWVRAPDMCDRVRPLVTALPRAPGELKTKTRLNVRTAITLLGRILDTCHAAETAIVLEPLCNGVPDIGASLGQHLGSGYQHAHRWDDYLNLIRTPSRLGMSPLLTAAQICFSRQMILAQRRSTFLSCWSGHVRLVKRMARRTADDAIEDWLFARLVILHFANRLLGRMPLPSFVSRAFARGLHPKLARFDLVGESRDLERHYRQRGNLRRSVDVSREIALATALNGGPNCYERVRDLLVEVEEQASIMGYEASAVNVLRDLCDWAIRHGRITEAKEYLREVMERNAASPAHPDDNAKNRELARRIERMTTKSSP